MPYHLYARPRPELPAHPEAPEVQRYDWVLLDASGEQQASGENDTRDDIEQTLSRNSLEAGRLIGLIPGDEALFCFADIPAKQARYIRQALPFAVEEQLAQDIDTVHLALGSQESNGYRVTAIDHQRMAWWRTCYGDWEDLRLEAIYPDGALLPVSDYDWVICVTDEEALVANRKGEWLTMRAENLPVFAQTLAVPSEDEVVAEISVAVYSSESWFADHEEIMSSLAATPLLALRRQPLEGTVVELLAQAHYHHLCTPTNLCQAQYTANENTQSPLAPWKPAIAVAAVWFLLLTGGQFAQGFYHQQQANDIQQQAMAIYREAFPDDRRASPANVRRILEGQLRAGGQQSGDAGFLALMKQAGHQYSRLPGNQSVSFNSVNYSRSRGELVVDVRADTFEKLNALRSGISGQGLEASIGSVVNDDDGARARLTVTGG